MKCPKCYSDNPDTQRFCGECGTQLGPAEDAPVSFTKTLETPVEDLTRGATFASRYEIIEELGKGGICYLIYPNAFKFSKVFLSILLRSSSSSGKSPLINNFLMSCCFSNHFFRFIKKKFSFILFFL